MALSLSPSLFLSLLVSARVLIQVLPHANAVCVFVFQFYPTRLTVCMERQQGVLAALEEKVSLLRMNHMKFSVSDERLGG